MAKTKFLDLDALIDTDALTVRLGGADHKLKPLSVDDYVANQALVQKTATSDLATEIESIKTMLLRNFPSMNREMLGNMALSQLNALLEFANDKSGANDDEDASPNVLAPAALPAPSSDTSTSVSGSPA